MSDAKNIIKSLKLFGSPRRAKNLSWFFKTGPGEYGEGDVFLGVTVPQIRMIVKDPREIDLGEVGILLASKFHEVRLAGALCLVAMAREADIKTRKKIFEFYLKHRGRINNWDLVDLSSPTVAGEYLLAVPGERKVI